MHWAVLFNILFNMTLSPSLDPDSLQESVDGDCFYIVPQEHIMPCCKIQT